MSERITALCRLPGQKPGTVAVLVDQNDLLGGPRKDTSSGILFCTITACALRPKTGEEYTPRIVTLGKADKPPDGKIVETCADAPATPQKPPNGM